MAKKYDLRDKTELLQEVSVRILNAITAKFDGELRCEACGHGLWNLERQLFTAWPLEIREGKAPVLPVSFQSPKFAIISCKNCGNAKFFNYQTLDLPRLEDLLASTGDVDV